MVKLLTHFICWRCFLRNTQFYALYFYTSCRVVFRWAPHI